ncbi:MAG TPA: type II toxin-antitoxin system RelE/ParE family toxin [Longimicrobium sp.]|nr:type II toxin-antitoxin system RelE/ParE family toxin [Longimicrobium sp.]
MIQSFARLGTRDIYEGADTRAARRTCPLLLWPVSRRKLDHLNRAKRLTDLSIPPNNRFQALHGDRTGQFSIRINDQFRICFVWTPKGPASVEIIDYH